MAFAMKLLVALLALIVILLAPPALRAATPTPPPPVRSETIASANVGETREFLVSLPDGYDASDEKYPVLLMLDGEFNFNSGVIGGLRHAAQLGEMPEFIVVGIVNTDRPRDCFPDEFAYRDGSKAGGRADRFLAFIGEELVPHLYRSYRCEPFRVLYGTSNSGFTAVYALLSRPELADGYVAASATLRVPNFPAKRDQLLGGFRGGERKLCLVMGENDFPTILSQNGELKEQCDAVAPAGPSCRFSVIENAGHVPENSLLHGLRRLFAGWKIILPLTERNFAEIRLQVDERLKKFGVSGKLPEAELEYLGKSLLARRKNALAVEVAKYQVASYPRSAGALASLGDAYREDGKPDKARECFRRTLVLDPGHAAAAAKLKELDSDLK